MKTAAIVIIGDEILSGKIKDTNSYYLAGELRALGVNVKSISVIPDDVDVIAKEVSSTSKKYNYVFTSGGIGPTHDDLTIEGIAKGFGLKTHRNNHIVRLIKSRCRGRALENSVLKMAYLPEGTEVIKEKGMGFPVLVLKNIFIFPGIPRFLRRKFSLIKDRFRSLKPFHLKNLYVNDEECFIAPHLERIVSGFPDVSIGSYPDVEASGYKVKITLESKNRKSLLQAYRSLLKILPHEIVVNEH
ncbi:MAG: competence/damage-inducible protein A [Nitrospirae bacterium]|nr:competence/damage-inducible protein A [Nitrospirota bacterium]